LLGIISAVLLSIVSILPFAYPLASQYFLDTILPGKNIPNIAFFSLALLGVYLLQGLLSFAASYLSSLFSQKVVRDVQLAAFHHALLVRLDVFEKMKLGDLASRVTIDAMGIRALLTDNLMGFARNSAMLVLGVVLMFLLDYKLALLTLPCLVALLVLTRIFGKSVRERSKSLQERIGRLTSFIMDPLYNIVLAKVFVLENHLSSRLKKILEDQTSDKISLDRTGALAGQLTALLASVGNVLILGVGGAGIAIGQITIGQMVAFNLLFSQVSAIAGTLASTNLQFKAAQASLERLMELHAMSIEDLETVRKELINDHSIRLWNVSFSYPNGRVALRNVSFSVRSGETVALVGPNGSGKSTVVKLLLKLYDVGGGEIMIGNNEIQSIGIHELRSKISFVPQEEQILPFSIGDNIVLGRMHASRGEVEEAARRAGIHDFILRLPNGYDTILSERGINISGGERQRISLARAFLKNSPILVLDEASSQIDALADEAIRKTIETLFRDKTVIVIAHRMSTVMRADKIVVLNEGQVEATGRHFDLVQRCSLYAKLCKSQFINPSGAPETGRPPVTVSSNS
jgi:ABC-type multidrug transport system fused ATPase/permease subunit